MRPFYCLHYAPDNASLIVRLALEEAGLPYETALVDRARRGQKAPDYLRLNPNGLIPVLETPECALFETGAILLWLGDRHGVGPGAGDSARGDYLKWLVFVSNTLHADLRITFYPGLYVGDDAAMQAALVRTVHGRLAVHLRHLDTVAARRPVWLDAGRPTGLCWYIACLMRWMALYPRDGDRSWFRLTDTPALAGMLAALETRPAALKAAGAEGLGPTPFTNPRLATPPEGSAT